jgi:protein phosphatase slingshot
MGISRSASVVIAYAMKRNSWTLAQSMDFVKKRRTCVKPNESFVKQLEIYQGILDASKHRHNSLWRSVSESSLRPPSCEDARVRRGGSGSSSAKQTKYCSSQQVNDENRNDNGRRGAKRNKKCSLLPPKM